MDLNAKVEQERGDLDCERPVHDVDPLHDVVLDLRSPVEVGRCGLKRCQACRIGKERDRARPLVAENKVDPQQRNAHDCECKVVVERAGKAR